VYSLIKTLIAVIQLLISCLGAWQRSLSINMLEWLQCLNCIIDWFYYFLKV
jgi:hypothetical protein